MRLKKPCRAFHNLITSAFLLSVFLAAGLAQAAPTLTTLYHLGDADQAVPHVPNEIVLGSDGLIYGTTQFGGPNNYGAVFQFDPATTNFVVLATFNGSNGRHPKSPLVEAVDHSFFGTTYDLGPNNYGTLFQVMPSGIISNIFGFDGGTYGAYPTSGVIIGPGGDFWGTTSAGGPTDHGLNPGTFFRATGSPNILTNVGYLDSITGFTPGQLMMNGNGIIYGTAQAAGSNALGTVYYLNGDYRLTNLVAMDGVRGGNPLGAVIEGLDSNLYGTASTGGPFNLGTVFKVALRGPVLSRMVGFNGTNGATPSARLLLASDGNFYGTTIQGGVRFRAGSFFADGTLFRILSDGTFTSLVSFGVTNGSAPAAGLIRAADGNLYGTTQQGGVHGGGTIFKLNIVPSTAPVVLNVTPSIGIAGTPVTITGINLDGATAVRFNGVLAPILSDSATTIQTVVPTNATTGRIRVTTPHGAAVSPADFTIVPAFTAFTPTNGPVGTLVTFTGINLTGVTDIRFNGIAVTNIIHPTNTAMLRARVPLGAATGTITLSCGPLSIGASGTPFYVTPRVDHIAPTSGGPTESVTIDGLNFHGATNVSIGSADTTDFIVTDTQIIAVIPTNANTGVITVYTPDGSGSSTQPFYVSPIITNVTPNIGFGAETITISGYNLNHTRFVRFNGVNATVLSALPGSLSVLVPINASSGKITVITTFGTNQSPTDFKVTPHIDTVSPGQGVIGSMVTIHGVTLQDVTNVSFNGVDSPYISRQTPVTIIAMIPGLATDGPLVVTNPDGSSTNINLFGVLADTNPPTINIRGPLPNSRLTNAITVTTNLGTGDVLTAPQFALSGIGRDNGLIDLITIERIAPSWAVIAPFAATPYGLLISPRHYTNNMTLVDGTNTFRVKARDFGGNFSVPFTNSFFFVHYDNLTVAHNGGAYGSVLGSASGYGTPADGAALELQRGYTIKAIPANGCILSNWTDEAGTILGTNLTLGFIFHSNMVLNANLIPNPTLGVVGQYNGLFYEANLSGDPAISEQSAGAISSLVLNTNRGFSGTIHFGGTNYSLSGHFDLFGDSQVIVPRDTNPSDDMKFTLHINWTNGSKQITGMVEGSFPSAVLLADLAATNSGVFGSQTVIIPPVAGSPTNSPGGYGHLYATNRSGLISLSGNLGDNTAVSQTVPISKDGNIPFYYSLYGGTGLVEGWLNFSSITKGKLTWIGPVTTNLAQLYPHGFTNVNVDVSGAAYTFVTPAITPASGVLSVAADLSGLPLQWNVAFTGNTLHTVPGVGTATNRLTGAINPTNGVLSVSFRPTGMGTNVTAKGAVDQNLNTASGVVVGPTTTGALDLH